MRLVPPQFASNFSMDEDSPAAKRALADGGDAAAQFAYGVLLQNGRSGVEQDLAAAVTY